MTTGRRFLGTPIVLRFVLAAVFLWAGVPKVFLTMELSAEQAAMLANMGVIDGPAALTPAPAAPLEGSDTSLVPADDVPDAGAVDGAGLPAGLPAELPSEGEEGAEGESGEPVSFDDGQGFALVLASTGGGLIPGSAPLTEYSASDFVESVEVPRLYGLIFLMNSLAQPKAADAPGIQVLPTQLADNGQVLKMLAWAAGLTEFACAVLVLIGLLTRLSAFALAGTMVAALWMTMVGPSIGMPDAFLGFLPAGVDSPPGTGLHGKYSTLMLQLMTFGVAFALVFLGAGVASLDNFLFGKSKPAAAPSKD